MRNSYKVLVETPEMILGKILKNIKKLCGGIWIGLI
jgi:hypothetical protein